MKEIEEIIEEVEEIEEIEEVVNPIQKPKGKPKQERTEKQKEALIKARETRQKKYRCP